MNVLRISSFSEGGIGGNPAGVVIADHLPSADVMQATAAEVGFSETAFAARTDEGAWRVRYFSPESEVPFCGHATIALGAALAGEFGNGTFKLILNETAITVDGQKTADGIEAALQSPATRSKPASPELIAEVLRLFDYDAADLDERIPPAEVHGGADHFAVTLNSREALSRMSYDLEKGKALMNKHGWVTILLSYSEKPSLFHTRNAFASGGVMEDPATGAATAAYAGYLRDIGWPHGGKIVVRQGHDMGFPSLISAGIGEEPGSSIRVWGAARLMD